SPARANQIHDRLRRAQTVAADRPTGVLEPDDTLVERLQLRAAEVAPAGVGPALQCGDGIVERPKTGADGIDGRRVLDQRLHTRDAPQGAVDLFEDGGRVTHASDELARLRRGYEADGRSHPLGQPGGLGRGPGGRSREDGDDAAHRASGYGLGST